MRNVDWIRLVPWGIGVLVVTMAIFVIVDIVAEANEPASGEITQLLYHKAYNSTYYTTQTVGKSTISIPHTQHHPERFEVVYKAYNHEEEKWEYGDCDVYESWFNKLEIGEHFDNPNRSE